MYDKPINKRVEHNLHFDKKKSTVYMLWLLASHHQAVSEFKKGVNV
jgi:hypothetical protein